MEYKGCYGTSVEIIEEASLLFGDKADLNSFKFDLLYSVCAAVDDLVDDLSREFDFECADVNVDMETRQFSIGIRCSEVIFGKGGSGVFYNLVRIVDSFRFSWAGDDRICITLNIENMWIAR